ncbi:hypothetical protein [Nocardia asiatica]|uniref:hypothetical protein n=1 Tax=Nocardia asiatica TaxID=209252 RepID=UPI0024558D4E|nr:hypothetical protein [Nocardia asiatica]
MTDYLHDSSAVTRWLDTNHAQFYTELATRLDIEAGLEEVLLAERHNSLVEEIRDKLDIEAGLAAILPQPPLPLPDTTEQPYAPGTLEWASDELARMPLQIRLRLRGSYAAKLGFAAREVTTLLGEGAVDAGQLDAAATRIRTLLDRGDRRPVAARWWRVATTEEIHDDDGLSEEQKKALIRIFQGKDKNAFLRATGVFAALEEDDQKAVRNATDATDVGEDVAVAESGIELQQPLNAFGLGIIEGRNPASLGFGSMQRWKNAVADYVESSFDSMHQGMLSKSENQEAEVVAGLSLTWAARVSESLTELASYLLFLEQMLNDFIGADLRKVDLAGVPLEGLRWSEQTTQWPDRWRDQIKEDSVHIENDVYEIRYGTHTRGRNTFV